MIEIAQLSSADEKSLGEINALLKQLSSRLPEASLDLLQNIVENESLELWVVRGGDNDKIVGMGELAVVFKPEGIVAQIEDVVVDEGHRGKGVGKTIVEKLIERARARGARVVQLSSNASRVAANKLYAGTGFKLHETNSYRLEL